MTEQIPDPARWFLCNTGDAMACTAWPYELIAADLASVIGDSPAREACRVIGDYASRLGHHKMLSSLLVAFGDGLKAQYAAQSVAEHPRRDPFVIPAR